MNSSAQGVTGCAMIRATASRRAVDVAIRGAQRAHRVGFRREFQRGLGDQRQRAFRADEQACQVVADGAFGGVACRSGNLAIARDRAQAQHVLARGCRTSPRAGRRRCRRDCRRRCNTARTWDRAARTGRVRLQRAAADPPFNTPGSTIAMRLSGSMREDPVHALETRDHAAGIRHGGAGGVGAAPARDQRHAMCAASRDQRIDLLVFESETPPHPAARCGASCRRRRPHAWRRRSRRRRPERSPAAHR